MSDKLPAAKKSLGQHWLTDRASLEAMCEAAQVKATDTVVEIGPGTGTLTRLLVERAGRVIAIEFDRQLAAELSGRVPAANLEIVHSDILSFDFTALAPDYKIVANIPYYLTSNLIRVISETPNQPVMAVLLVQKEVAERVAAGPGAMSLLSATAQFYWEVDLGDEVPAYLFTPPPKVDSQILILTRRAQPRFTDTDPKDFFRLIKIAFSQRRKTLLNTLSSGLHIGKPAAEALLSQAGIDPTLRPQTLSLEQWHDLFQAVPAIEK